MPKYRITAPTGETYEVTAPDGATQDQVMSYVQSQHSQASQPQNNQNYPAGISPKAGDVVVQPAADQLGPATFGEKLHDSLAQSPYGSAARALGIDFQDEGNTPDWVKNASREGLRAGSNVAQGVVGLGDLAGTPIRAAANAVLPAGTQLETGGQAIQQLAGPEAQPRNTLERYEDVANRSLGGVLGGVGVGGILSGSASPVTSAVGQTLASNPGAQTLAALSGGASAQTAKEAGAGAVGQTAAGLVGGLGGAVLPSAVSSAARNAAVAITPVDEASQQLAQEALARGIPIKASQLSDSKTGKFLDSASGTLPFSGAPAFEAGQKAAFNRALSKTIGADSDAITPQVFDQARKATGDIYNDVWGRNNLALTPDLRAKVNDIVQQASIYDPSVGSQIKGALDRISNNATLQNGKLSLPGAAFKALDSDLGAATAAGGTGANLIADLRYSLRDAMQKGMSDKDQALADQANRQWANQEAILPLVAKASAQGGEINPSDIMARVTSNYAGKSAMARGTRGELGTLAQIGQRFLKPSPSSGTAERGMGYRSLEGAGKTAAAFAAGNVMSPVTGAITAGGTLLTARGLQNALQNQNVVRQAAGLTPDTPDYWQLLQSSITPSAQQATQ